MSHEFPVVKFCRISRCLPGALSITIGQALPVEAKIAKQGVAHALRQYLKTPTSVAAAKLEPH
jgi:hypothetical protein